MDQSGHSIKLADISHISKCEYCLVKGKYSYEVLNSEDLYEVIIMINLKSFESHLSLRSATVSHSVGNAVDSNKYSVSEHYFIRVDTCLLLVP